MKKLIAFILLFASVTATAQDYDMINVGNPEENVITGGQPSIADLKRLKDAGVTTIISLRRYTEYDKESYQKAVEDLGMTFIAMPTGGSAINAEYAIKLDENLSSAGGKALVHCASSGRVGAAMALREFYAKGRSEEEALARGKAAGLKSLEGHVKTEMAKGRE